MPAVTDSKYLVNAGWKDIPHLTEKMKDSVLDGILPYQKKARSSGFPSLGSGAIYPVDEDDITVKPFELPLWWPRIYALDVGWNRTAGIWGAWDKDSDIVYLYSEHYRGSAEPAIHAAGIKARGEWIPGVVDPAARARGQRDGEQLLVDYRDLGLNLYPAINAREAGLLSVWNRLSTGRLKVFSSLVAWFTEYRIYCRDEKGMVVKKNDHLMDATRYLIISGLEHAIIKPVKKQRIISHDTIGSSIAGY